METGTETFLVKIWLEKDGEGTAWRGRVTHVQSGDRRHLKRFKELRAFMMPYIMRMGVRKGLWWKLKQWWTPRAL